MKKKRKRILSLILGLIVLLIVFLGIDYIPKKLIKIIPTTRVHMIEIQSGETGEIKSVTEDRQIKHIIDNFNDVKFQKGLMNFSNDYGFKMKIHGQSTGLGEIYYINSSSEIRYNSFSYTTVNTEIDYEFLKKLFS